MIASKKSTKPSEQKYESPKKFVFSALTELREENKKLRKRIERLEKQSAGYEENIELLMKELIRTGCVNIGERRRILKRTSVTQEALIQLLKKKGYITQKSLLFELKKMRCGNSDKK